MHLKPKILRIPLLDSEYHFFIGWAAQRFAHYIKRKWKLHENLDSLDGLTIYLDDGDGSSIIVIWTRTKKPSLVAHEIVHAANFTLKGLNIDSRRDDELQCRLVEHLLDEAV